MSEYGFHRINIEDMFLATNSPETQDAAAAAAAAEIQAVVANGWRVVAMTKVPTDPLELLLLIER